MPVQFTTIARNTFIEAIRQPIFFVIVAICGIFQLFNTWGTGFAMDRGATAEVSGDNKLLLDIGLATVFGAGVILAAFIATAVVSREIENKTVLTVVSKPVARPTVILGKYAGVAMSMMVAVVPMLIFLLMGIRHGVMSTAADFVDYPVIVLTLGAVGLSMGVALWCNFFYGWYFTQTFMLILAPGMILAYVLVLMLNKRWQWQPIGHDFKGQITFACLSLAMAILVLTAVATAVSTRLGQVMTIVICGGVFLFGLLSNYLVGRHAFTNTRVGIVKTAAPADHTQENWAEPGDLYTITLINAPARAVRPGDPFFYSSSPNGFPLSPPGAPIAGGIVDGPGVLDPELRGLVVTAAEGNILQVRRIGRKPLRIGEPPEQGDSVFVEPTRIRPLVLGLWSVVPNMHYFWLVDAVSQNQRIPVRHMALVGGYAASQIAVFLSLGVILFQKRDVG